MRLTPRGRRLTDFAVCTLIGTLFWSVILICTYFGTR